MTRKHFNAIAKAFADSKPDKESHEYAQWEKDVRAVANSVSQFNQSFDFLRFIQSCGID